MRRHGFALLLALAAVVLLWLAIGISKKAEVPKNAPPDSTMMNELEEP